MRQVYRSGLSSMFRWMGIGLVLVALLVFGLFPVMMWTLTSSPQAVAMLIGLPVFVVAGAVMFIVGTRQRIVLTPEAVSWSTALGPAQSVSFGQIRQVEVPTDRRGPGTVVLHLVDGRRVPIRPLRMSLNEASNYADAGYLRAAEAVRRSHSAWWHRGR